MRTARRRALRCRLYRDGREQRRHLRGHQQASMRQRATPLRLCQGQLHLPPLKLPLPHRRLERVTTISFDGSSTRRSSMHSVCCL
eukprot:m.200560 g.200560  ORF g.200560 m.200560 type:complete len:85 (-) comp17695_c0_seq3:1441-1695(-)